MRYLLFAVGLLLSSVAAFYSVTGLAFVFAGAFWPVVVMGASLEAGKIMAASWVFRQWRTAPRALVAYLSLGVLLLMLLTGIGIFGYLTRAYLAQQAPIAALVTEKTVAERTLALARQDYDRVAAEVQSFASGQTTTNQVIGKLTQTDRLVGRNGAVSVLRTQQTLEADARARLRNASETLAHAEEGVAAVDRQTRAQTVDVGPLMFAAKAYYGTTDLATMDKVVTAFILLILAVFDPMAIALLLAAQSMTPTGASPPSAPHEEDAVTQAKMDAAWQEMVEKVSAQVERENDSPVSQEESLPTRAVPSDLRDLSEHTVQGRETYEPATLIEVDATTDTDDISPAVLPTQLPLERPKLRSRRTRTAPKR